MRCGCWASFDMCRRAKSERKLLEAKLRKKEAQVLLLSSSPPPPCPLPPLPLPPPHLPPLTTLSPRPNPPPHRQFRPPPLSSTLNSSLTTQVAKLIQAHKDLTRAAAERESSLQRAISALEERARVSEADATKARSELADARGRLEDVARQLNGSRESATQARNVTQNPAIRAIFFCFPDCAFSTCIPCFPPGAGPRLTVARRPPGAAGGAGRGEQGVACRVTVRPVNPNP